MTAGQQYMPWRIWICHHILWVFRITRQPLSYPFEPFIQRNYPFETITLHVFLWQAIPYFRIVSISSSSNTSAYLSLSICSNAALHEVS